MHPAVSFRLLRLSSPPLSLFSPFNFQLLITQFEGKVISEVHSHQACTERIVPNPGVFDPSAQFVRHGENNDL